MDQLLEQAQSLLRNSPSYAAATVEKVVMLAGDMGTRRYARVFLGNSKIRTAILMLLNQAPGPVKGGRQGLTQDDTFVDLTQFLSAHGINVPKLYIDGRKDKALLVEDVGALALWQFAFRELEDEHRKVEDMLGGDALTTLFVRAIDITARLQSIPYDKDCVAFHRWVEFEQYRREIGEFLQYYAEPRGLKPSAIELLGKINDAICECIMSHPKTLSHFDYMPHNLFVDPDGQIRVLDFQDMCLVSPVRDIVSLINDRDTDSALGQTRHAMLLSYFMERLSVDEKFPERYNEYLLHWDFRVSGRFCLLAEQRGVERYRAWIPGTLRRLGRTLMRAQKHIHLLDDALDILTKLSPEIREGAEDPWDLPVAAKRSILVK